MNRARAQNQNQKEETTMEGKNVKWGTKAARTIMAQHELGLINDEARDASMEFVLGKFFGPMPKGGWRQLYYHLIEIEAGRENPTVMEGRRWFFHPENPRNKRTDAPAVEPALVHVDEPVPF
jgi:hypothetical protein